MNICSISSIIGNNISKELILVYGLIIAVIILIVVILVVDKINSRKKDNLFDSRKLSKRLNNLRMEAEKAEQEESIKKAVKQPEIAPVEKKQAVVQEEIEVLENDPVEEVVKTNEIDHSQLVVETVEETYHEEELEKTQAQIDVEAITRELEKAVHDEQAIDKYAKFEEEQEQNAIISYVELKEKFDKLYNENEKIQYMNDDSLPINLEELYHSQAEVKEEKIPVVEPVSVQPEKVSVPVSEVKPERNVTPMPRTTRFKSSPMISPVYGIQHEPVVTHNTTNVAEMEAEIKRTNEILQSLKDLQKNLE